MFGIIGGAGSLPNEKLIHCRICYRNGFPHEPIVWRELLGHDGFIVATAYDYYYPSRRHQHRSRRLEDRLASTMNLTSEIVDSSKNLAELAGGG